MLDELLQQAEATIRKGVRSMEADRLHGDVKIIQWSRILPMVRVNWEQRNFVWRMLSFTPSNVFA